MTYFSSFLLGLVQGIAEFLPISSSGHLALIHGVNDLAHGTTPRQVPPARRLILLIIVGTLPLFAVLPIHKQVQALSNNMVFIGAALVVTGFLLFACDLVRKGRKTERNATLADVLVVGVGQAIATMPGISRSGMTITTGCFMGFERKFAVRGGLCLHPFAAHGGRKGPLRRVCVLLLGGGPADATAQRH